MQWLEVVTAVSRQCPSSLHHLRYANNFFFSSYIVSQNISTDEFNLVTLFQNLGNFPSFILYQNVMEMKSKIQDLINKVTQLVNI